MALSAAQAAVIETMRLRKCSLSAYALGVSVVTMRALERRGLVRCVNPDERFASVSPSTAFLWALADEDTGRGRMIERQHEQG